MAIENLATILKNFFLLRGFLLSLSVIALKKVLFHSETYA